MSPPQKEQQGGWKARCPKTNCIIAKTTVGRKPVVDSLRCRASSTPGRSPAESEFPPKLPKRPSTPDLRPEARSNNDVYLFTPGQAAGAWNIPARTSPSSFDLCSQHRLSPRHAEEASSRVQQQPTRMVVSLRPGCEQAATGAAAQSTHVHPQNSATVRAPGERARRAGATRL